MMMDGDFEWNVFHEGQLLDAMVGHKPVGMYNFVKLTNVNGNLTSNPPIN